MSPTVLKRRPFGTSIEHNVHQQHDGTVLQSRTISKLNQFFEQISNIVIYLQDKTYFAF